MAKIQRVALAGKGRIGSQVVSALMKAGFETTILTRSAAGLSNVPDGARVREVDYESAESLTNALKSHDAVVSAVAMSGIPGQTKLIDAAIAAGVKLFIPAEYTMATRDPKAQWLPMYSTVLEVQRYLESREPAIEWVAMNCGALVEFVFDYPFVLDFDRRIASFYDGGDQALSLSNCDLLASAIAAVLSNPHRVKNHRIKVHGGQLTQKEALQFAQEYSGEPWTIEEKQSELEIRNGMESIQGGATGPDLVGALLKVMSAATFGEGHYEAAYEHPDNDWLGIPLLGQDFIKEAIRKRVTEGPYSQQSSTSTAENLSDVAEALKSNGNPGGTAPNQQEN